ncbi:MAG: response regulator [Flavobacteriia bacterium]|jgi:DNA-binding NarL/FixJ family response regulator
MKVLLADDHPIFRSGLKFLLENSFDKIAVFEVDNGQSALDYLEDNVPDIVILDIDMPLINGLEVCAKIQAKAFRCKVIILTMYKDIEMLKMAFFNGANGYLVKDNTSEELVECIQTILENKTYLSKDLRDVSKTMFNEGNSNFRVIDQLKTLTNSELKTLKLVSQKYSSKEISDLLFVTAKSVENYRSRICKKLNLDSKSNSLVVWVLENKAILDKFK